MPADLPFRRHPAMAATLLIAAQALWALTATAGKCVTHDEIAHVVAGQAYWAFDDYRLQPENGNLPQRWAALPAWLLGARFSGFADPAWRDSDVWTLGYEHFYQLGNPSDWMLWLARTMNTLWAAATAGLVFAWTRRLFGTPAAFGALAFCLLDPDMLAHGPLATSDMAATFFLVAAAGAFWRHLQRFTVSSGLLSAVTFGLACLTKYSAMLLLPVGAALVGWRLIRDEPIAVGRRTLRRPAGKLAAGGASVLAHLLVAVAVIWAAYGFRFAAANPALPPQAAFARPWSEVLGPLGAVTHAAIDLARQGHLLPEAYLYGLAHVLADAGHHGAFLNGAVRTGGWWWFFPYAFLVKTPLPILLALAGAAAAAVLRWRQSGPDQIRSDLYRTAPLWIFAVIYWASSMASGLNIGLRHVLPTFPALFILGGFLGRVLWRRRRAARLFAVGLLLWTGADAWAIRPDYLAFFNPLAGGPAQGYRHLVDSSLDWGQDLPGLAQWIAARRLAGDRRTVYLSYFGSGDEDYEGIRAVALPRLPARVGPTAYRLGPGIYCISATMLQQPYGKMPGPWTLGLEQRFVELRSLEASVPPPPAQIPVIPKSKDDLGPFLWRTYDWLRFTRLCHFLRARDPAAEIGHSILIYDLTAQDLHAAVGGSLREWTDAITRSIQSREKRARSF